MLQISTSADGAQRSHLKRTAGHLYSTQLKPTFVMYSSFILSQVTSNCDAPTPNRNSSRNVGTRSMCARRHMRHNDRLASVHVSRQGVTATLKIRLSACAPTRCTACPALRAFADVRHQLHLQYSHLQSKHTMLQNCLAIRLHIDERQTRALFACWRHSACEPQVITHGRIYAQRDHWRR